MRFLFAGEFLQYVQLFRIVRFVGRYGGSKTLLSVAIADEFARRGYDVSGNIHLNPDLLPALQFDRAATSKKVVFVLDEAWLVFLESNKSDLKSYFAYTRKRDHIVLLPSVLDLDYKTFWPLWVERWFNGLSFGLPFQIFSYVLRASALPNVPSKKKWIVGKFAIWRPQQYYAHYNHWEEPKEISGIFGVGEGDMEEDEVKRPVGKIRFS